MKKILLIACLFVFCQLERKIQAQTIVAQTINSAGLSGANANGSLIFAVGDLYIPPINPQQSGSGLIGVIGGSGLISSVEDEEIGKYFHIYPNPTPNQLHIKSEMMTSFEVNLSDTKGITQQTITFEKDGILYLEKYPAGVYLLKIATTKGQKTFKIIKN